MFVVAVILPAVVAVVALPVNAPVKFGAVTLLLNVFAPAIVCAPVEINPGLVSSAAAKVSPVPLMLPPTAYEVVVV